MRPFKFTIACSRPAVPETTDGFNNVMTPAVEAIEFAAVFVPPGTQAGSQIVDGQLRETTITKPTLYVDGRPDLRSGDYLIVDGEDGWQVDGDPAEYTHPWTGWQAPLVVELRHTAQNHG